MALFKRVGMEFVCEMGENPDPEFWEPVAAAPAAPEVPAPTEAAAPPTEAS